MRFAGIDIGAARHVMAVVGEDGGILVKATGVGEDAAGYEQSNSLQHRLGSTGDVLVVIEATGHYWQNLFAVLAGAGYA